MNCPSAASALQSNCNCKQLPLGCVCMRVCTCIPPLEGAAFGHNPAPRQAPSSPLQTPGCLVAACGHSSQPLADAGLPPPPPRHLSCVQPLRTASTPTTLVTSRAPWTLAWPTTCCLTPRPMEPCMTRWRGATRTRTSLTAPHAWASPTRLLHPCPRPRPLTPTLTPATMSGAITGVATAAKPLGR